MLLIIFLYAVFAATFSLGKELLNYGPPFFLVGIRMFIAGALLLFYQYFFTRQRLHFKKEHVKYYIQLILFSVFIPYTLRLWALKFMPAYKASLLYNLGPFVSYILGYFFHQERITAPKIGGLFIGTLGLIPVLITTTPQEDIMGTFAFVSWPELALFVSVSSLAYGWVVLRKLIKDKEYPPAMVNGMSMFAGGILALVTSLFIEPKVCIVDVNRFLILLTIIILASNVIGHNLYAWLMRFYTPTFLSFASFLTPIFAALYGWLFFNEIVTWHFFASTILIMIGLGLFYKDEIRQQEFGTALAVEKAKH